MKPNRILSSAITAVLASALTGPAPAQIVGDAADYNVFVFGDFNSADTDTQGNLAAGGNVSLISYQVASSLNGTASIPNSARLVAGGTVTAKYGSVGMNKAGSIYTNGSTNLTSFTATGKIHAQTLISSFTADQAQYTHLSASLDGLGANGKTSGLLPGDTLDFTGTAHGLNVFDVSGATLDASKAINISVPKGATVLINVTGSAAVSFSNGSVDETGVSASSVLYNVVSATAVDLVGSKDPEGSILAPLAAVTGGFGRMTGQLIADSYHGNTQFNSALFTGNLSPVPEPATAWLLLSGFVGIGVMARSRRSA